MVTNSQTSVDSSSSSSSDFPPSAGIDLYSRVVSPRLRREASQSVPDIDIPPLKKAEVTETSPTLRSPTLLSPTLLSREKLSLRSFQLKKTSERSRFKSSPGRLEEAEYVQRTLTQSTLISPSGSEQEQAPEDPATEESAANKRKEKRKRLLSQIVANLKPILRIKSDLKEATQQLPEEKEELTLSPIPESRELGAEISVCEESRDTDEQDIDIRLSKSPSNEYNSAIISPILVKDSSVENLQTEALVSGSPDLEIIFERLQDLEILPVKQDSKILPVRQDLKILLVKQDLKILPVEQVISVDDWVEEFFTPEEGVLEVIGSERKEEAIGSEHTEEAIGSEHKEEAIGSEHKEESIGREHKEVVGKMVLERVATKAVFGIMPDSGLGKQDPEIRKLGEPCLGGTLGKAGKRVKKSMKSRLRMKPQALAGITALPLSNIRKIRRKDEEDRKRMVKRTLSQSRLSEEPSTSGMGLLESTIVVAGLVTEPLFKKDDQNEAGPSNQEPIPKNKDETDIVNSIDNLGVSDETLAREEQLGTLSCVVDGTSGEHPG